MIPTPLDRQEALVLTANLLISQLILLAIGVVASIVETGIASGDWGAAVLGLGFNVVAPAEGWPAELQSVAGALFDGDPAPGARAALAAAFLNEFWPLYRTGPRSGYLDEYRSRLALTGQRVLGTPRSGTPRPAAVLGIDDECRLVVRYDGEIRPAALTSGEAGVRLL